MHEGSALSLFSLIFLAYSIILNSFALFSPVLSCIKFHFQISGATGTILLSESEENDSFPVPYADQVNETPVLVYTTLLSALLDNSGQHMVATTHVNTGTLAVAATMQKFFFLGLCDEKGNKHLSLAWWRLISAVHKFITLVFYYYFTITDV